MYKRLIVCAALSAAALPAMALSAGDLAFTSFNSAEDGWSMVALADISANSTLFFSDNEWNGSAIGSGGAFNTGESFSQWVTGAALINAGTMIRFSKVDDPSLLAVSVGTFTRATVSGSANWGISTTADTVYAFEGSLATAPTVFIAAVTNQAGGAFSSLAAGVLTNTGLTAGSTAIALPGGTGFSQYTGPRATEATFGAYQASVNNVANWSAPVANAAASPDTTAFSITAVPEPSGYALMLAGFAAVGFATRRRT